MEDSKFENWANRTATVFGRAKRPLEEAGITCPDHFWSAMARGTDYAASLYYQASLLAMQASEPYEFEDESTGVTLCFLWPHDDFRFTYEEVRTWLQRHNYWFSTVPVGNPVWREVYKKFWDLEFPDLSATVEDREGDKFAVRSSHGDLLDLFPPEYTVSSNQRFLCVRFVGDFGAECVSWDLQDNLLVSASRAPISDIRKALLLKGYKLGTLEELEDIRETHKSSFLLCDGERRGALLSVPGQNPPRELCETDEVHRDTILVATAI